MNELNLVIGWMNVIFGVFLLGFALITYQNKVGINNYVGFKFAKAYESEENWYNINHKGGQYLLPWSILTIVFGFTMFIIQLESQGLWFWLMMSFPILVLLYPSLRIYQYTKTI
ncbi:MAG: SdpI family protein [Candidatus Heimdallarchaeota archaeon]|nr:SdpI family protein [Candidatus Heimdallarchaeota archaeon]